MSCFIPQIMAETLQLGSGFASGNSQTEDHTAGFEVEKLALQQVQEAVARLAPIYGVER